MENGPTNDDLQIKHGDFPVQTVTLPKGNYIKDPVNPTTNLIIVDKSHDKSPHGEITRLSARKKITRSLLQTGQRGFATLGEAIGIHQARKSHVPLKIPVVGPGHVFFCLFFHGNTMRENA